MLWKWVELPRYAKFCRAICEKLEIEYEGAFDEVRWAIEEDVCRAPFSVSHPDPRFGGDERWRYFRTWNAPGRMQLPQLIVTFRVERFPELGNPGVIEGREVWVESDLRDLGLSLLGES